MHLTRPSAIKVYLLCVTLFFSLWVIYASIASPSSSNDHVVERGSPNGEMQKMKRGGKEKMGSNLLEPKNNKNETVGDGSDRKGNNVIGDKFTNDKVVTEPKEKIVIESTEKVITELTGNNINESNGNGTIESIENVVIEPVVNINPSEISNEESNEQEDEEGTENDQDPEDNEQEDDEEEGENDNSEEDNDEEDVEQEEGEEEEDEDEQDEQGELYNKDNLTNLIPGEEVTSDVDENYEGIFVDVPSEQEENQKDANVVEKAEVKVVPVILSNAELFQLIESDQFEVFNKAIQTVNNIEEIWDDKGYNLLHRAIAKFAFESIDAIIKRALIGFGNVRMKNESKLTTLHLVVIKAEGKETEAISEVVKILIQGGADIETVSVSANDQPGITPLLSAIVRNNVKAMEAFLINGANPNVSFDDMPLLHHAFNFCGTEGIDLLLKYKADFLAANKFNRFALHEAVVKGKPEIVSLLVEKYKCRVDIRTPTKSYLKSKSKSRLRKAEKLYNATPLHYAYMQHSSQLVKLLLKLGADKYARDAYDMRPKFYDEYEIVEIR